MEGFGFNGAVESTEHNAEIRDIRNEVKKLRKEVDAIKSIFDDTDILKRIYAYVQLGVINVSIRTYGAVVLEDSRTDERIEITVGHKHF